MFSNNPFNKHRANDKVLSESKFLIPEEIPANEKTAFHGAAAGAAKDGKTSFTFAGKKYPVTMKKDTAKAIADQKEATHTTDYFVGHNHAKKAGMGVKVHSKGADGDNVTISHSDPKKLQKYVDNHLGGGKIKEGTTFRERLMSLYEGDRAAHYKSATKPEEYDEKQKSSKGAMDMMKTPKTVEADGMKAAKDTAAAIRKSAPGKKMRKGDQNKGDLSIKPSATPVNDPSAKIVTAEEFGMFGKKISNNLLDRVNQVTNKE